MLMKKITKDASLCAKKLDNFKVTGRVNTTIYSIYRKMKQNKPLILTKCYDMYSPSYL